MPAEFVSAQLDAVLGVYDIRALKTGMLSEPTVIRVVADKLAAALVAELTRGRSLPEAVKGAKAYVHAAIKNSYLVGKDCGVLGFSCRC